MDLILRPPTQADEESVRGIHDRMLLEGFEFCFDAEEPWEQILTRCEKAAAGIDLPPDRVPADFLLAEVDGQVVGRTSIRHALTPFLLEVGGHIGYGVAPEHRRRGYATEILRQSVEHLAGLGVYRILVTCDDGNVASARTIERNGGVLEDIRPCEGGPAKRRYWIEA